MIFSKSKTFLILLVFTFLLAITFISAIVMDNNTTINEIKDCTTEFYGLIEDV